MAVRKRSKKSSLKYFFITALILFAFCCIYFFKPTHVGIKPGNFVVEVPEITATPNNKFTSHKIFERENTLRKEIEGQRYIFETKPVADGKYTMVAGIYSRDTGKFEKELQDIVGLIEYISDDTVDFWIDRKSNAFITLNTPGGWMNNNKTDVEITKYTFKNNFNSIESTDELFSGKLSDKHNMSLDLHFYKNNRIILSQSDAVNCFISGAVYLIENKSAKEISEFTNGCKYEHPRFGGIVSGKIIFANAVQNVFSSGTTSTGHITLMYAIDVESLQKSSVTSFSAKQNFDMILVGLYKDESFRNNLVSLFDQKNFMLFNIDNKSITKIKDMSEVALEY